MVDKPNIAYYPASRANVWANKSMPKVALVCHTMGGYFEGTRAWFSNPASSASTNFGVSQDGRIDMYVDPLGPDSPFANGYVAQSDEEFNAVWAQQGYQNANYWTISIEHEDKLKPNTQIVDYPSMFEASTLLAAWLCQTFEINPLASGAILGHYQIDGVNRRSCPGWNAETWDTYLNEVAKKMSVQIPEPVEALTVEQRLHRVEALLAGNGINNVWTTDAEGRLGNDPEKWLSGDAALDFLNLPENGSSAYQALFKVMYLMQKHGLWE